MIGAVGDNYGIIIPDVGDVRTGTTYGHERGRTGALAAPDAPVITAVVDNGDADSVTVSITGTDTIRLFYRLRSSTTWTIGNTRSGSGDIVQGGLTAGQWYEMYVIADDGAFSAPSNLVSVFLAAVPGTGTIKLAIHAILSGASAVTDIVGTRIFPGGDPVRGVTAVAFYQITDNRPHTHSGPDDLVNPIFQVNSYATSDLDAETLSDAVADALNGFSGTVSGVSISYMALTSQGDVDDFQPGNKALSRHGIRQDYLITFTEL